MVDGGLVSSTGNLPVNSGKDLLDSRVEISDGGYGR